MSLWKTALGVIALACLASMSLGLNPLQGQGSGQAGPICVGATTGTTHAPCGRAATGCTCVVGDLLVTMGSIPDCGGCALSAFAHETCTYLNRPNPVVERDLSCLLTIGCGTEQYCVWNCPCDGAQWLTVQFVCGECP